MNYILKGSLCGSLNETRNEPLGGVGVMLYLPLQTQRRIAAFFANMKETFHIVTKEEAQERECLLIAAAKTDVLGHFEFVLDEKYKNTVFDIDSTCGIKPSGEPMQIHLGSVQPQWDSGKSQLSCYYEWNYCMTAKWWYLLRGYFFEV
jgi:hypothetical protein